MQVKLLRQAAGRDDRIVAAYEDVTFLNEHVGWYPIIKDRFRKANDIVVVVLRVGDVCFEAGSMFRRGMLRKEYIEARTAEARNLRAAVQRRMENLQWIPSSYVAAYEALGWDARPLKGHRARMRELYAAEDRRREQVRIEREKRRQRQEEARLRTSLKRAEAAFREEDSSKRNSLLPCAANMGSISIPGRSACCKDGLPIYPERRSIAKA